MGSMQLGDDDIYEFTKIWQEEFDEILSPEDVRKYASSLLTLYALLAQSSRKLDSDPSESESGLSSQ